MRGCRQSAYWTMLKEQTCLIPFWLEIVPAQVPLIRPEAVAWLYRACIWSINHWLIPYLLRMWIRHWWEIGWRRHWNPMLGCTEVFPLSWNGRGLRGLWRQHPRLSCRWLHKIDCPWADRQERVEGNWPWLEPVFYIRCLGGKWEYNRHGCGLH